MLIMDRNIKNYKNRALIPQYTHTFLSNICDIMPTIYFCSFILIENVMYHFY